MSSNRIKRAARSLLVVGLAAMAAACATSGAGDKTAKQQPLTPTEQFAITVTPHEDQILLAPHAAALSPAQSAALEDLVDRWRDGGDGFMRIQTPQRGDEDVYRATGLIQDALMALGVRPDQVKLTDYDPGPRPNPPIVVGFTHYEAQGPQCGRNWSSFTHSADNGVNNNFGCATTANVAAMVADPHDFLAPRDAGASDGGRRVVVLGKWQAGQITSTPRDPQATGAVSNVGQ